MNGGALLEDGSITDGHQVVQPNGQVRPANPLDKARWHLEMALFNGRTAKQIREDARKALAFILIAQADAR
jgi:hypothetical protein